MFDIKTQQFYFKKNVLQSNENIKSNGYELYKTVAIKGDKFYGIFSMAEEYDSDSGQNSDDDSTSRVWEEIRTFKFEKDTLVETGVKWETEKRKYKCSLCYTTSALFVQNIKLI